MKTKRMNGTPDALTTGNETAISRIVTAVFAFTVFCILVSVCFLSHVDYPVKSIWISNLIPIAVLTPILLSVAAFFPRPGKWYRTGIWKAVLVLLLFLIQIQAVYCYFFYTSWDVKRVISTSLRLAHGEGNKLSAYTYTYYSNYPNNLFLTSVFSGIIRVLNKVFPQTKGTEAEYVALLAVQCFISQMAGVLTYCAAKRLFGKERYAYISYCLFILLAGISPWVSIPYSDSMGLAVPVAVLLLYLKPVNGKKVILKWFGIAALSWLGYKLKPQLAVIFIAVVMIELFTIRHTLSEKKPEIMKAVCGIITGIVCAVVIVAGCLHFFCNIQTEPEKRFGMAHFLMMGMNPGKGIWDSEDVAFSRSFDTARERDSANLQRAAERIGEMGPEGLAKQIIKKTLINYNDGTFAWDDEGYFRVEIRERPNDSFSSFVRDLYYADGKYHPLWKQVVHAVWVSVLFLSFFSVFGKKDKPRSVMMLTVIGLTVFLTVFEARARYIYSNLPIFILLAVSGLQSITEQVRGKVTGFSGT